MWCFELVSGSVRQLVIGLRDSFRPVVAEFLVTALHVTCGAAGQLGLIKDCHVTLLSHSSGGIRLNPRAGTTAVNSQIHNAPVTARAKISNYVIKSD